MATTRIVELATQVAENTKRVDELHFIVQNLPKVIEGAESKLDASIADRVTFQGCDFFTPRTVVADAYLFRWIFHNWPDNSLDIIMLSMLNPREREAQEWQDLFLEADPRFGGLKILKPIGASLAIIEAIWQE